MTADAKVSTLQRTQGDVHNHPLKFSHGTLECRDLSKSRKFYEEFLGLETVRHADLAMLLRFPGTNWAVVCMGVGDKAKGNRVLNHWGLDLKSPEEVDQAHALCHEFKEEYGIGKITTPMETHGNYQFYFRDLDDNWWEFQYVSEGMSYDDKFARGDKIPT